MLELDAARCWLPWLCCTQLAYAEHFQQQPLSCLAAAASSGSSSKLAAAVRKLAPAQLARCCGALLGRLPAAALDGASGAGRPCRRSSGSLCDTAEAAEGGLAAAVAALQAVGSPGSSRSKAAGAAADVLHAAVWGAMQAFGSWRLGVLLLHLVASFTGEAGCCAGAACVAASSRARCCMLCGGTTCGRGPC